VSQFVERPWGGYQIIYQDFGVVVKILTVNPGKRLSLQKHAFRAETWHAATEGMLAVIGEETYEMEIGKSVAVDVGMVHRLINYSNEVGRVVEVITGNYDEEDIVRLEDDFGRGQDD
jgi:mannose-6-phosphate isomerase-like protein (cupin superfamily)